MRRSGGRGGGASLGDRPGVDAKACLYGQPHCFPVDSTVRTFKRVCFEPNFPLDELERDVIQIKGTALRFRWNSTKSGNIDKDRADDWVAPPPMGTSSATGGSPSMEGTLVPEGTSPDMGCMRKAPCEICGFSNHSSYDCKNEPLWNYGPELCAAQVDDQSFFYIEEHVDHRAIKEKASTTLIIVIEGEANAKQIENELKNTIEKGVWKWAARKIADNKFTMRFLDAKMVQACSKFKSLGMK
jgi:hypothetical protein